MNINSNIFFDTNRRNRAYFSFGGGAGMANIKFQNNNIQQNLTLGLNAIAQFNVRITDFLTIYAKYKYSYFLGRDYKLTNPVNMQTHYFLPGGQEISGVEASFIQSLQGATNNTDTVHVPTQNNFHLNSFGIHFLGVGAKLFF